MCYIIMFWQGIVMILIMMGKFVGGGTLGSPSNYSRAKCVWVEGQKPP